jgi:selenocysteine lyase/cysteine desulfurase
MINLNIKKIREDFPLIKNRLWFQNGFVSAIPTPVMKKQNEYFEELYIKGPMHLLYPEIENPRRIKSVKNIAKFIGAENSEIALTLGVSDGFLKVINSIDWNKDDEIIITTDEAAIELPCKMLSESRKLKLKMVPLVENISDQINIFKNAITNKTKLIAFSHVTTDSGHKLPAKEICDIAKDLSILTYVDLAHSVGVMPINVNKMNCDFASILSYKWTFGPYSVGALYVNKNSLNQLDHDTVSGRVAVHKGEKIIIPQNTKKFESGPWCWPLIHTWSYSLDYLSEIGISSIWNRTKFLTQLLKDGLLEISGVKIFTPYKSKSSGPLVTFQIENFDEVKTGKELKTQYNIDIKYNLDSIKGLRASIPFFMLEEEIEKLLKSLKTIISNKN